MRHRCVNAIFSQLPNLVLVDLPGIVGSAVCGEPDDLADRTQKLVSNYISREVPLCAIIVFRLHYDATYLLTLCITMSPGV